MVIAGIDWGNDSHFIKVQSDDGTELFEGSCQADPESLYELRDQLLGFVDCPEQLIVAIEDPSRSIARILMEAGIDVYILSPRRLDSVRTAYAEADTKSDAFDAHVLCEELRTHRNIFYKMTSQKPVINSLSKYYRSIESVKHNINHYSNRLREVVRDYFPQFLELNWSLTDRVMRDLLELVPTSQTVEDVSVEAIDNVLGRCRKHSAEEVRDILASAQNMLDNRTTESCADIALDILQQLNQAMKLEQKYEDQLTHLLEEISKQQKSGSLPSAATDESSTSEDSENKLSDVEIIMSTKGIGVRSTAGLFAEGFHSIVSGDRQLLRKQSIAPVTKQTGKQSSSGDGPDPFVRRRYARNKYLNKTMHDIGNSLQRTNSHYRQNYLEMKHQRNHTHGRACRQIADQSLRVLFAMLRDRTTYDPELHGATRQ